MASPAAPVNLPSPTSAGRSSSAEPEPAQAATLLDILPAVGHIILTTLRSEKSWQAALATCRGFRDAFMRCPGVQLQARIPSAACKQCTDAERPAEMRRAAESAAHSLGVAAAAGALGCVHITVWGERRDQLAAALPADLDFTALRWLQLIGMKLDGIVPDDVQQRCPQLAQLTLYDCIIHPTTTRRSSPAAPFRSLQLLSLKHCHMEPSSVDVILAHCPPLPGVVDLTIDGGAVWLGLVQRGLVQPQQVWLSLDGAPLPPAVCQPELWPALERLELGQCEVNDALAACLVALPSLQRLCVHGESPDDPDDVGTAFTLTSDHRAAGAAWAVHELVLKWGYVTPDLLQGLARLPPPPSVQLQRLYSLRDFESEEDVALLVKLGPRITRVEPVRTLLTFEDPVPAGAVAPLLRHVEAVDMAHVQLGPELWDEAARVAQGRELALHRLPHGTQLPDAVQKALLYYTPMRHNKQCMVAVLGPRPGLASADVATLSPARAQELVEQVTVGVVRTVVLHDWGINERAAFAHKLHAYFQQRNLRERLSNDLAELKASLAVALRSHMPGPVCKVLGERFWDCGAGGGSE